MWYLRKTELPSELKDKAISIEECGIHSFIPCIAQGGPGSVFPGVYASMCEEIDKYNIEKYGATQEELDAARLPWQIMF